MPGELDDLREGYEWRRERDLGDLATLCAVIMNASGRYSRAFKPEDLLQQPKEAKTDTRSGAEKLAEIEWLKQRLGGK